MSYTRQQQAIPPIRVTMGPGLLTILLLTGTCSAQEWAEKMFQTRSHNFGTIARAAKAEYAFELTNLYVEDVHIASVRSSCGCTTPRIEKDTLKSYEQGAIVAHINSDRFLGNQGATLTVTIDRPYFAQVLLHVKVFVYSDVLLEPSGISLGTIAEGSPAEQSIRVQYTGRRDWQVTEVRSANPHLTATVTEASRQGGRVTYDLKAVLANSAPAGYLKDYVWLMTNDPGTPHIPVPVEGQVQAEVTVSPSSLFLGVLRPGQSVTKQIVVRGRTPFQVDAVRADCGCLHAEVPTDQTPKSLYLVPVTFTAGEKAGKMTQTVLIETNSGKTVLRVPAHAVIQMP